VRFLRAVKAQPFENQPLARDKLGGSRLVSRRDYALLDARVPRGRAGVMRQRRGRNCRGRGLAAFSGTGASAPGGYHLGEAVEVSLHMRTSALRGRSCM